MLNEEKEQFQKEQDEFLNTILNLRFFLPWKNKEADKISLQCDSNLEIYITSECNQKCEYCYLHKYEGLYPRDKLNHNLILENLKTLYEWILEQDFHIPKIEFFTGEIWHTQFGLDVLELSLQYLKKGMLIDQWMIASNCSFIFDKIQLQKIQHYIDSFQMQNSPLKFSISVDGAIIENDNRPVINGTIRDDEYWENVFAFAKHNNYCFHPMVAAYTIEKWVDNYKWFEKKFKQYDMDIWSMMMLEVRNSDWTDNKIQAYTELLEYLINKYYTEECHNKVDVFTNHMLCVRARESSHLNGYIPFCLTETDSFIGCTQATDLTIRVGDLAICPCHRLAYDKYLYGHLKVDNNKIIGVEANNPQLAVEILMANFNSTSFKCDTCIYNSYCLKGCRGAQYESTGDPLIPDLTVCHFFDKKYSFLLKKYEEMGVFEYLKTFTKYEQDYERVQKILTLYKDWKSYLQG